MRKNCPHCRSQQTEQIDDNGARFPETRIVWFECLCCGREHRRTLAGDPRLQRELRRQIPRGEP